MANYIWIALPGQWLARLATALLEVPLFVGSSWRSAVKSPCSDSPDQKSDAQPSTMQTIERVMAVYQEKVGWHSWAAGSEFRRVY